jgi:hypothetical protein
VSTCILAIDPGPAESGWMVLEDGIPIPALFGKEPNADLRQWMLNWLGPDGHRVDAVVIEEVHSYGMPVGREVFDTVRWTGRFEEVAARLRIPVEWLGRKDVVVCLCGSAKAKDPNVRRALLDRFGGDGAKGTKARPGPLHGVSGDVWSALAVGCAWFDLRLEATR